MNGPAPLLAVVDDDADVREALTGLVSAVGFAVESFASGAAFLSSIEDHEPDCVLLDLYMPGLTGFEIQAAMAAKHSAVPVLIVSAQDSAESRRRALDLGAKGYLAKPVDREALLSAIDAAIGSETEPARGGRS